MSDEERAAEIAADCRERRERGEVLDTDEILRAHPDLAVLLRSAFAALHRLEAAFPDSRPATRRVGRTLGPYRLVAELGAGGMGTVYLAELATPADGPDAGAHLAVKVLHPHLLVRPDSVRRLLREADIGRRVRHENVVRTLESAQAIDGVERLHYVVMEYVEGRTLRALLDEFGRVPEELCRHIGREVAKALVAIHAAGAVHRDLKPDNVLITKDDVVKVMDLGVAWLTDEAMRLSQTGAFVGSVRYGAPEQFGLPGAAGAREATPHSPVRAKGGQPVVERPGSADVDGRADLYALGLTLYELATGRHPFEGDDFRVLVRQQMTEVPRPAGELNPQLSAFFEEVLRRLLEKDRDARFVSAAALLDVLEQGEGSAWWQDRAKAIRTDTRRPLRRIRIPRETALYGRDTEIAKLRALFDATKAGDGQVVLVEGEAGIGKSRLVDEFVGLLAQSGEDVNFLYGSYPPGGAATASGAFTSAYREQLGGDETSIRAALPQTPLLVPAFAALLRGDVAPEGAEPLTKDSLQTVFVHATRSFAAQRPTIVLIDDLHFAPEEGRSLFAALALAVPGHRVLFVGTARPEIDAAWVEQVGRGEHVSRIRLSRLGAKDLVMLLRDSLRSEHLAEELAAKIAVKSDGNPFFVFEILRGLRDGQFLTRKPDGTWVTTKLIAEIEVPGTVKDLIFARVGNLSTVERNLLDVAACAGFEFDPVLVGEVLHVGPIPVLQRLAAVEKSHRLVRSVGRRFVFDHHQVAEVLYAGLPEMLREEYHASIAAAIERRQGAAAEDPRDLDGALCVDLAEHYLKGAQGQRAIRYLDAALGHLEKGYLNDAAVRLADGALAVPGLVAGRVRCGLLWRKVDRLGSLGRRDAQRAALDEAYALAIADGEVTLRSEALRRLGVLHARLSHHDEARAVLGEALLIARAAGNRQEEAIVRGTLGNVHCLLGLLGDAREHQQEALAAFQHIGDRLGEGRCTGNLGAVLSRLGHLEEAQQRYQRALVLAREVGDREGEALGTTNLGFAFRNLGRLAEAQEHLERSLALARESGFRPGEAVATGNLSSVLWALGFLGQSLECAERHVAISREIGDRAGDALGTKNAGVVLGHIGRFADAREHIERSIALAREIGDRRGQVESLESLAFLFAEEGDAIGTERLLAEALQLHRAMGQRGGEAGTLAVRGAHHVRQGREVEARCDLNAALALARELSLLQVELLATAQLATLPGGDVAAALAALAAHERRVDWYDAMQVRFLLWQATRDPAHLADAKRRLDFIVEHAPPDCRESMLANVRLHREIAAAARGEGLPLAADASRGSDGRPAGSADA